MPLFNASKGPLSTSGRPLTRTSPWSGVWMPAMIFISVDLPAPFSPISAWTVPACSRNRTLSRATTPGKALRMPSISSNGTAASSAVPDRGRSMVVMSDILLPRISDAPDREIRVTPVAHTRFSALLGVPAQIVRGDQLEGNVYEAVDRLLLDQ